jgi:hypothetical protein
MDAQARKEQIKAKLNRLTEACNDAAVTDCEFRHLFALVLQFHCTDSGHCHPSDAALGRAAGGKCTRTAGTQTRSLQAKGYLTKTKTLGASNYTFKGIKAADRQHLADLNNGRSATSCSQIGNFTSEDRQPVCRTEPFPEPLPKPIKRAATRDLSAFEKLEQVIGAEHAGHVIDHMNAMKKPLTAYRAEILAGQLSKCPYPKQAADEMIERGWTSVKRDWLSGLNSPKNYDDDYDEIPVDRTCDSVD